MAPYQALQEQLGLDQGIPHNPQWSAPEDFMQLIVEHVLAHKPRSIVECSSGLSSLMLARCCQLNQYGQLYSLENGLEYAQQTRAYIARYALEPFTNILHAPLEPREVDGEHYQWYAIAQLPEQPIDMLVIDGPPGYLQKNSRYPALPLLYERLADGCTIFMDDAARADERAIVELWQSRYAGLEQQYLESERGCAILRLHKQP